MKLFWKILRLLPLYVLATFIVLVLRLIRPWLLVRLGGLYSTRIGHFAANTELYLCERDAGMNRPAQRHIDVFFLAHPICNLQMLRMWKRTLCILPTWILARVNRANQLIPGGAIHEVGTNSQHDRDVHNLMDRLPPHLKFTAEEEVRGEANLRAMGIPPGASFVCLIVRDSSYLGSHVPGDWSFHDYRDSDSRTYVLAAEELADRGYFVIRMGAKVHQEINCRHHMVIDYATNGMRSDFMDIYLSAKCAFCLSGSTGLEAVSAVFRRPVVSVNMVPIGWASTFRQHDLLIFKGHFLVHDGRELTLKEIFACGVGANLSPDYRSKGVRLIDNTPDEIRDAAVEMAERLSGMWRPAPDDETRQGRFKDIYPAETIDPYQNRPLHGEIRVRIGAKFLRAKSEFLD